MPTQINSPIRSFYIFTFGEFDFQPVNETEINDLLKTLYMYIIETIHQGTTYSIKDKLDNL